MSEKLYAPRGDADAIQQLTNTIPKDERERANKEYESMPRANPVTGRVTVLTYYTSTWPYIVIHSKPGSGTETTEGVFISKSQECASCKLVIPQGISSSAVKLKRFTGDDIVSKLFILPNIPFKFTLSAAGQVWQVPVPVMSLYHPCPIRIENVQYDAVLSLGDLAEDSVNELKNKFSPSGQRVIVLIPIQVKTGGKDNADSDAFFQKIVSQIPGILEPIGKGTDKLTDKYEDIDVTTGNDFSLSKVIKTKPDNTEPIAEGGYFGWGGSGGMELYVKGYDISGYDNNTYRSNIVDINGVEYAYRPKEQGSGPIYIMMKNPVGVTATTMNTIKLLPITNPEKATHPIILRSVVFKPGPPGSDVVGCKDLKDKIPDVSSIFGTTEGFEGAANCDPFNNFPTSANAENKRIEMQETFWKVVGGIGATLAIILTIWLAVKFVQSPYGKVLFGKIGEKLADAFAKVDNVPSMFDSGGGTFTGVNPMIQPSAKPQQKTTLRNVPPSTQNKTRKAAQDEALERARARIQQQKEAKKRFQAEQAAKKEKEKEVAQQLEEAVKRQEERVKLEKLPKLPTDEELYKNRKMIAKRKQLEDLYRRIGEAKSSFDAATMTNAPNAGEKEQIYNNTKAQYADAKIQFMKEADEHIKLMKEILAARKEEAKRLEEETKAAQELAKQLEESHKKQIKQEEKVTEKIEQVQGLKRQNASSNLITSAAASLNKEKEELEKKQQETQEIAEQIREIKKDVTPTKKEFDTGLVGKLFVEGNAAKMAVEAAKRANELLQEAKETEKESNKVIQEAEETYRKATSTLLPTTASTPSARSEPPPAAHAKTIKRRNIKIEEPEEEVKDTQKAANAVDARLQSSDLSGANKAATQLVSNARDLKEEYKKMRDEIQEQHRMEGTTVTAREIADARRMVVEAEKIEKGAKEVKENVQSAMSEEDKEKAARDLRAAEARLRYTNRAINNIGLPSLQIQRPVFRIGRGKGRRHRNVSRRH